MSKEICPLLRKPCIENKCAWWCSVRGYDVNTGKEIDQNQCIVGAIPFLLIENSSRQRGTQAAVESMRNEVVVKADTTNRILSNILIAPSVQELPYQEVVPPTLPSSDN
jgi:hypothetical protein